MKLIQLSALCLLSFLFLFKPASSLRAVYVGGGLDDDNREVWGEFIRMATPKSGSAYVGVITAASDAKDAKSNGKYYVDLLKTYHVSKVEWLPIDVDHIKNAQSPSIAAKVATMTGIFFGGGDQERLITCFKRGSKDTVVLAAIRAKILSNTIVVGGTSAGTDIQQGADMIMGGQSWDALTYGAFEYSDSDDDDALLYDPNGGFGFYQGAYIDTHFGTRGRQGRMMRLIYDTDAHDWGIGIDENTAIAIEGNKFTVSGYNGVYIINMTLAKPYRENIRSSRGFDFEKKGHIAEVKDIYIHYLTSGDSFDLSSNTVTFANNKQNIKGHEQHHSPLDPTTDIFSSPNNYNSSGRVNPEMFTNITTDLFNSNEYNTTWGYTYETDPYEFKVFFDKKNSEGYFVDLEDERLISYQNLYVEFHTTNRNQHYEGREQIIPEIYEQQIMY